MSEAAAAISYDRKKVRKAMLLAPLAALLGILPYFFVLNLSFGQMVAVLAFGAVFSYIGGALFGAPGYFLLKALGRPQSLYLVGYAVALVLVLAVLLQDSSVLISIGPPVLLAALAFCWIRGEPGASAAVSP